jgi:hypothetical protein
MSEVELSLENVESVGPLPGEGSEGALESSRVADFFRLQDETQCAGRLAQLLDRQRLERIRGIPEDRHPRGVGHRLFEQAQPFADDPSVAVER